MSTKRRSTVKTTAILPCSLDAMLSVSTARYNDHSLRRTDFQTLAEVNLPQSSTIEIGRENRCILLRRVTGHEAFFEFRANDNTGALRKLLDVTNMIEVPMAPDNALNLVQVDTALLKDLVDIIPDVQPRQNTSDKFIDSRWIVPPILAASDVKADLSTRTPVLEVEAICRHVPHLVAFNGRPAEELGRDREVEG